MIELLNFLILNISGSDAFKIAEEVDGDNINYTVQADPSIIGVVIGKEGKTIKNIRRLVSVRAVLEKKSVRISVIE